MSVTRSLIQQLSWTVDFRLLVKSIVSELANRSRTEANKRLSIKDFSLVTTHDASLGSRHNLPAVLSQPIHGRKKEKKNSENKFLPAARRKKEKFLFLCVEERPPKKSMKEAHWKRLGVGLWWSRSHWHQVSDISFLLAWCVLFRKTVKEKKKH